MWPIKITVVDILKWFPYIFLKTDLIFYGQGNDSYKMWSTSFLKLIDQLCWGLTSSLVGHFVLSHREREKRDRKDDGRGDQREGQRRKRKMSESEETEEIKTFHLYPYLLQKQQALPNCKLLSWTPRWCHYFLENKYIYSKNTLRTSRVFRVSVPIQAILYQLSILAYPTHQIPILLLQYRFHFPYFTIKIPSKLTCNSYLYCNPDLLCSETNLFHHNYQ